MHHVAHLLEYFNFTVTTLITDLRSAATKLSYGAPLGPGGKYALCSSIDGKRLLVRLTKPTSQWECQPQDI